MRTVVVYKTSQGDWIAECPSLRGCICRAASKAEALDGIREAIDGYIAELKKHRAPIPEDNVEVSVVLV